MNKEARTIKYHKRSCENLVPAQRLDGFIQLPYSSENSSMQDAVVSVAISTFSSDGLIGYISERQSLSMLLNSKLLSDYKVSPAEFRRLHAVVFLSLAINRVRISTDAYTNFFLPRLATELSRAMKLPTFGVKNLQSAIIHSVFEHSDTCGLKEKIMCKGILCNREIFARYVTLGENEKVTGKIKHKIVW
ncbi:unnamed protein product [Calicophoron daubneyi]|uniref:Uncharacterized protein n=1 Tax=Calicophoron daubneyi TaxID=300641 RepID=A0AAV2TNT0_CALDB